MPLSRLPTANFFATPQFDQPLVLLGSPYTKGLGPQYERLRDVALYGNLGCAELHVTQASDFQSSCRTRMTLELSRKLPGKRCLNLEGRVLA